MNDELIDGSNTDTVIGVENTDNTAIAAENVENTTTDTQNIDNDATNAENTDNAALNADNTSNAATDSEKSDDAVMCDNNAYNTTMSHNNRDNAAMSNNNTYDTTTGDSNTENTTTGETSMVDISSPLHYGRKTKDLSKVKTSKIHTPIMVEPSEPLIGDPPPDEIATAMVRGHAFDPTDVRIYDLDSRLTKPTGLRRYRGGSITGNTMKYPRYIKTKRWRKRKEYYKENETIQRKI